MSTKTAGSAEAELPTIIHDECEVLLHSSVERERMGSDDSEQVELRKMLGALSLLGQESRAAMVPLYII